MQRINDLSDLKPRFESLWRRCGLQDGESAWATLRYHYEAPERHYHGAGHLAFCLQEFDAAAYLIREPAAVELSLWFHDAIIVAGAGDNESRSADLFRRCAGARIEPDVANRVSCLILATAHREPAATHDAQYLCDIDLASLGLPWNEFLRDCRDLRAESTLDDANYDAGKLRFYDALLLRPCIFGSSFFRSRYEAHARKNMARFTTALRSGAIRWQSGDDFPPTITTR